MHVPCLAAEDRYKGQSGKVAVLGGCTEYTSAPYFSSVAALQVGADLSHVFCTRGAASILKTLCPDIIVHPYLMETHELSEGQVRLLEYPCNCSHVCHFAMLRK